MAEVEIDIWVDFMTMSNEGRLWARLKDVRLGFVTIAGQYAVVGDDDADRAVSQIISADIENGIVLQVLDGSVDEHRHLLTTA